MSAAVVILQDAQKCKVNFVNVFNIFLSLRPSVCSSHILPRQRLCHFLQQSRVLPEFLSVHTSPGHIELFKGLGHNAKIKEILTWAPVDFC